MAYDVLVKGGRVIDPASQTDGPLDVGIQGGRIAKVTADIDASEAAPCVDARGKLVVPGLIDIHAHIFEHVSSYGLDPDLAGVRSGVTTIVGGGSSGRGRHRFTAIAAVRPEDGLRVRPTHLVELSRRRYDNALVEA